MKDACDIPEKTTADLAQGIICDAWEAQSRKERIRLAKKALFISPHGAEAGRRFLGEEMFGKDYDYFWGYNSFKTPHTFESRTHGS